MTKRNFGNQMIECEIRGEGAPTALVHGSGVDHFFWSKLVDQLPNRKLYIPDMIGHGKTPSWKVFDNSRRYQVGDDTDLLESLLNESQPPIDLIGHSYGGTLCLSYAIRFPERVGRMILIEPNLPPVLKSFDPVEWERVLAVCRKSAELVEAGRSEEAAKIFFEYNLGELGWSKLPDKVKAILSKMMKDSLLTQMAAALEFFPPDKALAGFKFPILIIVGTATTTFLSRMSEAFHALLPTSKMEWVKDAAHMLPITHSETVNRLVVDFLNGR